MVRINTIFHIEYGNQFDLSKMEYSNAPDAIDFISRNSNNNGRVAKVAKYNNIKPYQPGVITVTMGGSYLLASFVQLHPFYTAQNVKVLTPLEPMSLEMKMMYCAAIQKNRCRYHSHAREANATFNNIMVPSRTEMQRIMDKMNCDISEREKVIKGKPLSLHIALQDTKKWEYRTLGSLFTIKKGKRLTSANQIEGDIPYIGAIDSNNGLSAYIGNKEHLHEGNTITVSYNGSIGRAYYQPVKFWASDDVNVLYPKFKMNVYSAMFLITLIEKEKYRFCYGRKWQASIMKETNIRLPITNNREPDWSYIENYIKGLEYSNIL